MESRTIQRRNDVTIEQMAELVASRAQHRDRRAARQSPWWTTHLKVFLSFDLAVPEMFEIRRVRALRDGLSELESVVGVLDTPLRLSRSATSWVYLDGVPQPEIRPRWAVQGTWTWM